MSKKKSRSGLTVAAFFLSLAVGHSPAVAQNTDGNQGNPRVHRVLLLSVDGFHRQDLAGWVSSHPSSTLAKLTRHGVTYTNAKAPTPSDSFPGLLALVTGGTPKSTGVYYDDSYDRTLYAPGSACATSPGTEVVMDESIDFVTNNLFSGGIDPGNLPLAKNGASCTPVYPHDFIKVNTIFEVIKAAGLHTAWSDKHPAYDLVNGPSGAGVEDLFTPEINSLIINGGIYNGVDLTGSLAFCDATNSLLVNGPGKVSVYTDCGPSQEAYDDVKVQAIINQIDGKKSDGTASANGVPAIFGMNFQSVSVGEKLPTGGYLADGVTPSALLAHAIDHTDQSIGRMVAELAARNLLDDTLIIVSAKHGQSPMNKAELKMEAGAKYAPFQGVTDPGGFIADVDVSQSAFANPNSGNTYATSGHLQTDDVGIVWLQDKSGTKLQDDVSNLSANAGLIFATVPPAGIIFGNHNIISGAPLAAIFGDPSVPGSVAAARAPDIFIQPDEGVIYSGSKKKIAEHGGGAPGDIDVALLVSASFLGQSTVDAPVHTMQVAPTILNALGLNPQALQSVVQEGTKVLPEYLDNIQ